MTFPTVSCLKRETKTVVPLDKVASTVYIVYTGIYISKEPNYLNPLHVARVYCQLLVPNSVVYLVQLLRRMIEWRKLR